MKTLSSQPKPLHLLILADGKAGHMRQSRGLALAIQRLLPCRIDTIDLHPGPMWRRCWEARRASACLPRPHLIIGAGHATHWPLLLLSRHHDAPSVVLMKPSLPTCFFDLCLIPQHDWPRPMHLLDPHLLLTQGALNDLTSSMQTDNRSVTSAETQSPRGLILLGGDSKAFRLDPASLREAIATIIADPSTADLQWHITDSRRSPAGLLDSLRDLPATLHPHQQCSGSWLTQQMVISTITWVTEESISMIFEALSTPTRVGLLPMIPGKGSKKFRRATDQLISQGRARWYSDWLDSRQLPQAAAPLREADRCASWVLQQLSPHLP